MAEAFDVNLPALTGYAKQVQRNNGYVRSAYNYMATEGSDTSEMEGLLAGIADGYKPLVTWMLGILDKISDGLDATTDALHRTAEEYRSVDEANSAKIDSSYRLTPGSTG